jgi:hypothetical protein
MPSPNPLPIALGGLVLLALSAGIAYLAASLAVPARPDAPQGDAAPASLAGVMERLDEIDRRIENLEETVRRSDERSRTALDTAVDVRSRLARAGGAPAGGVGNGSRTPLDERPEGVSDEDKERDWKVEMARRRERFMILQFDLLGDASPDAAQKRLTNARVSGKQFGVRWGLKGDAADAAAELHVEQMNALAEKVGPYLRDGLESASIPDVRSAWEEVLADSDRRLREILDEETWKRYEAAVKSERKETENLFTRLERR